EEPGRAQPATTVGGSSRAARRALFLRLPARALSALRLLALLDFREFEVDAHAGGARRSVTGQAARATAGLAVRGPRLPAAVPEAFVLRVLAPVAGHKWILPVPRSSFLVLRSSFFVLPCPFRVARRTENEERGTR